MLFEQPSMFGLVMDLSMRTDDSGQRIISIVKKQLINFVREFEDEDVFYLCQNPLREYSTSDLATTNGRRVALVGNWSPTETCDKLGDDMRTTLYAITQNGDIDGKWFFCLITDRYIQGNDSLLLQIMDLNNSIWGSANIHVFTIGSHYHFNEYEIISKSGDIQHTHLKDATTLGYHLSQWIKDNHD